MAFDDDMRTWLESSLSSTSSYFDIYERLRERVPEGEEEKYRALIWAFGYDLTGPDESERREREGSAFGAMFEFDNGRLPPRLSEVPNQEVEIWEEAFQAIDEPRVTSRLGDLLWERRAGSRPDQKARAAAKALIELAASQDWEPMESTDALVRALELGRSVGDADLIRVAAHQAASVIRAEVADEGEDRPGIPFTLLGALVEVPDVLGIEELLELIGLCEERYGEDPFHTETAIELRVQLADPSDLPDLRKRQVTHWREKATSSEGILRATFLQTALDVARTHGLSEEADEIRVEIANIHEEELDLKTVSSEVSVSTEELEKFFGAFLKFDNWHDSLTRVGIHGPPGGKSEEIDRAAQESMQKHPLQFLVRNLLLDPDLGTPIFEATDEASQLVVATAKHRLFATRIWSSLAVEILMRIENEYGRPSKDELVEYFSTSLIEAAIADRISRALELFWDGEYDESAHILAPRLEAIVREMARKIGIPIVWEPIGDKPGRVRSLGDLLYSLRGRLGDQGWDTYFFHLLSDPLGLNLRNVIGHGLRAQIAAEDAALLLHAACYMRLLDISTPADGQDSAK